MEVFYYRDPKRNFGDDLNAVLWPRIFSKEMYAVEDVVVVGIGSILTEGWLAPLAGTGKRIIILGSGTSYDVPPRAINTWSVQAVRGPLTASLIGMPEKAVTDGAILLAASKLAPSGAPKTDIIFMPHHRSIRASNWKRIAAQAGLTFVSPQQPVEEILSAFSRAKLVVAEAMHAAIVADTLRIPWIPVTISPAIDEFKWRDWCASMNAPFNPTSVAAGHPLDHLRYARMARALRDAGIVGHRHLEGSMSREALQLYFARRFSSETRRALLDAGPGRLRRAAETLKSNSATFEHDAVRTLEAAAQRTPYLSDDKIYDTRLNQMLDAVREAERIARGL